MEGLNQKISQFPLLSGPELWKGLCLKTSQPNRAKKSFLSAIETSKLKSPFSKFYKFYINLYFIKIR